jgi:thiamine pyrophosphate-dependent acetolactate synthase large subunit-like protein
MWMFNDTHFAKVAEAMCCLGLRVEQPSELPGALEKAFASDRPVVIDVVSDYKALHPRAWTEPDGIRSR